MNEDLLRRLSLITSEERAILDGQPLDQHRYTARSAFVVDADKMLDKGQLISVRPHTRFAAFPAHSHNYVEMIYMCQGKTRHGISGGQEIVLQQGDMLLLNEQVAHSIAPATQDDIAVNVLVLPQFFDYTLELIGAGNVLGEFLISILQASNNGGGYLHFQVADVLPIQNLVENLVFGLVEPGSSNRKLDKVTMGLLFLQLLHHTNKLSAASNKNSHVLVAAALHEIQDNYQTASLSGVAQRFGVSDAYVSALVHKVTGHTFKTLLRAKRLSKAADLLETTQLTIDDIIKMIGYENTSYFYRMFKEAYGVVPHHYRKQLNKDGILV